MQVSKQTLHLASLFATLLVTILLPLGALLPALSFSYPR